MSEFKVGDRVEVLEFLSFPGKGGVGVVETVNPFDSVNQYRVRLDGEEGAFWATTVVAAKEVSSSKLREPFLQFAMDLCFKNGYEVSNAIECALKLQEASE